MELKWYFLWHNSDGQKCYNGQDKMQSPSAHHSSPTHHLYKCFTNYKTISQMSFHLINLWKEYYHHSIVLVLGHVLLSVAPWTVTRQAPLSMEFSSQEYWSVLPGPPPGDFAIQGLNSCLFCLLHWQVDSLPPAPPFYTRGQSFRKNISLAWCATANKWQNRKQALELLSLFLVLFQRWMFKYND